VQEELRVAELAIREQLQSQLSSKTHSLEEQVLNLGKLQKQLKSDMALEDQERATWVKSALAR
jgi:hypothetical protein